jgi:hypothetical protein
MSNDNLITSDSPFEDDELQILNALVDTIVPPDDAGTMPGAGEINFAAYLAEFASDFQPTVRQVLEHFDADFAALDLADRVQRVTAFSKDQRVLFEALLYQVYAGYYQDDRVMEGIGVGKGAPFPRGNTVEPGDLSLLDPVVARGKGYRPDH